MERLIEYVRWIATIIVYHNSIMMIGNSKYSIAMRNTKVELNSTDLVEKQKPLTIWDVVTM